MVFLRFGAGFVTGIVIVHNSHEYVYLTIANSFVRPHWRYQKLKNQHYTKDHAVDTTLLDSYVKDVVSSFIGFWIVILPVVYKSYYAKPIENPGLEEKDNFAVMLNNINDK